MDAVFLDFVTTNEKYLRGRIRHLILVVWFRDRMSPSERPRHKRHPATW